MALAVIPPKLNIENYGKFGFCSTTAHLSGTAGSPDKNEVSA
jgi:hypothetical protein